MRENASVWECWAQRARKRQQVCTASRQAGRQQCGAAGLLQGCTRTGDSSRARALTSTPTARFATLNTMPVLPWYVLWGMPLCTMLFTTTSTMSPVLGCAERGGGGGRGEGGQSGGEGALARAPVRLARSKRPHALHALDRAGVLEQGQAALISKATLEGIAGAAAVPKARHPTVRLWAAQRKAGGSRGEERGQGGGRGVRDTLCRGQPGRRQCRGHAREAKRMKGERGKI